MWHFQSLKLTFCILLVYITYVIISFLNNKLFKTTYVHKHLAIQGYFVYADLLQALASGLGYLSGYFYSRLVKKQSKSPLPLTEWALLGTLFTLRVSCPNYALYFIPYTTRTIWDKLGYFSTVFFSVFLSRYSSKAKQKLPFSKLKTAVVISLGALFFTYNYTSNSSQTSQSNMKVGYLLMTVALISKGLFIDNQSYCKNHYKASSYQMLYEVNLASFFISLFLLTGKGHLLQSLTFIHNHYIEADLGLYCLFSVAGQFLIYSIAFNFKLQQNITPLLATTRKIVIIVVTIIMKEQDIDLNMTIGLTLVFGGMIFEVVDSTYYSLTGTEPLKVPRKHLHQKKIMI